MSFSNCYSFTIKTAPFACSLGRWGTETIFGFSVSSEPCWDLSSVFQLQLLCLGDGNAVPAIAAVPSPLFLGPHRIPLAFLRASAQPGGVHLPFGHWYVWAPVLHWELAGKGIMAEYEFKFWFLLCLSAYKATVSGVCFHLLFSSIPKNLWSWWAEERALLLFRLWAHL